MISPRWIDDPLDGVGSSPSAAERGLERVGDLVVPAAERPLRGAGVDDRLRRGRRTRWCRRCRGRRTCPCAAADLGGPRPAGAGDVLRRLLDGRLLGAFGSGPSFSSLTGAGPSSRRWAAPRARRSRAARSARAGCVPSLACWTWSCSLRIASMSISGPRRAAGEVHVDGDDVVDALDDRVVVEHAAAAGADAHREHPLGVGHLVVDLAQDRRHLLADPAGDDHQVGLARAGPEDLHAEAGQVVLRAAASSSSRWRSRPGRRWRARTTPCACSRRRPRRSSAGRRWGASPRYPLSV